MKPSSFQLLRWSALRAYYNFRIPKNRRGRDHRAELWPAAHTLVRPGCHVLAGYYDIPPFDPAEGRCAALAAPARVEAAYDGSAAEVGWFGLDAATPRWHPIGTTRAWCWQMGTRLRWHPAASHLVSYNDVSDGHGIGLVQDAISGRIEQRLPMAIYDLSPCGRHGLSLDFHRLHQLRRGYGYPRVAPLSASGQGVWLVDSGAARADLLVSLSDLIALEPVPDTQGAEHYVNHLSWSPGGKKFMLQHLGLSVRGRFSRLVLVDFPSGRARLLDNTGYAGHYCWLDADRLLCFAGNLDDQSGFFCYDTRTGERQPVAAGIIREDGHPSPLPRSSRVILDTYPDAWGFSKLFLLDPATVSIVDIGRFHFPIVFRGDYRCDLHPRASASGRLLAVDCVQRGQRVVSILAAATPAAAPF